MELDAIDRAILGKLTLDGRISMRALGDEVGLGASATTERVRRLEDAGAITGYRAVLNPEVIGLTVDAVIDVQLGPDSSFFELDEAITEIPQVVDAMHVSGTFDNQLRVRCRTVADLEKVLFTLKEEMRVSQTNTRIVLHTIAGMPRPPAI
ncbi:MAG: Lrp/AsnC family transcriptional regulator [Acidimicrobiales bacterium]